MTKETRHSRRGVHGNDAVRTSPHDTSVVIRRSPGGVGARFNEEQPDLDAGVEVAPPDSESAEVDPLMPPPRLAGIAAGASSAPERD